jgi:Phage integrase family.
MDTEKGQSQNLWEFAVYSGLRHGELAALAWEDVDLEKGTVHVRRNLNVLGMFGPPKTEAGNHTIALHAPALEALKALWALSALQPKTKVVFYHREHGKTEDQRLHFVFLPRMIKGGAKSLLLFEQYWCTLERSCKTCWHSSP